MSSKKIIFLVNELGFFISHRLPIAVKLKEQGATILILSDQPKDNLISLKYLKILQENNILFKSTKNSFFLIKNFIYFFQIFYYIIRFKPEIINLITIKPIIFGLIVSRLCNIKKIIISVSGMGFFFTGKNTLLKYSFTKIFNFIIKLFNNSNTIIIVQNNDDKKYFLKNKIISSDNIHLIPGSGVNLELYKNTSWKFAEKIVLFPARLLKDKGIFEFLNAAKLLKTKYPSWIFLLAGSLESNNPSRIKYSYLKSWVDKGIVQWSGHIDNMYSTYIKSSIICLPSYREGMPKSLQEAASAARPVVTTNVAGCNEVIIDNFTGILVPPRNIDLLVEAIEKLILDEELCKKFGKNGRQLAIDKYDVNKIVKLNVGLYN